MSYSLQPHELYSPWNSPGQNTGVGSLSLLQVIFPTQGSNPGHSHCRQILYQLTHQGSPKRSALEAAIRITRGRQTEEEQYHRTFLMLLFSHSRNPLFATPLAAACQASLSLTIAGSLPKFMSTESVMSYSHLTLCRPFLLLPSIFPSFRVFSSE